MNLNSIEKRYGYYASVFDDPTVNSPWRFVLSRGFHIPTKIKIENTGHLEAQSADNELRLVLSCPEVLIIGISPLRRDLVATRHRDQRRQPPRRRSCRLWLLINTVTAKIATWDPQCYRQEHCYSTKSPCSSLAHRASYSETNTARIAQPYSSYKEAYFLYFSKSLKFRKCLAPTTPQAIAAHVFVILVSD